MQFRFTKGEPRAKALANFSWEKSSFSKLFRHAKTASEFLKIWDKEIAPHLKSNGEYSPPKSASNVVANITPESAKRKPAPQLIVTPVSTPPPSKKAKVQEDTGDDTGADAEIDKCFFGKWTCRLSKPPLFYHSTLIDNYYYYIV